MALNRFDELNIDAIRSEFPSLANYTWFQNGGVSITPKCVADEHARLMLELLDRGPMHIVYPDEEYPRRRAAMERLAQFFSVDADELALMRGVSEAYQTVLRGLDWRAGDEIVISQDEEAAVLLPTLHLRDRFGVRVVKLPLLENTGEQIVAFENCLSERTKVVALSHVSTDLGWRLPMREICAICRMKGILSFVDLAHSAGVFSIDVQDLVCDFAGILSYKWMYAPYASGLLYARLQGQDRLAITYAGGRSEKSLDFENDRYELQHNAERFQYGPWSWPLVHTWATAAEWLQQIGIERIESRTAMLTTQLKDQICDIDQATLFTPISARRSAALVSFGIQNWTGESLANTLRERWNMIVKPLPHTRQGLRISIPFFMLEEEIDRLAGAIRTLAAQGPTK